jgi:DMSO reductase anchor subunit
MIKMFRYLYYRLYSWNLKTWGENDLPQWNALFGVSFMMFLNLGLVGLLLQAFGMNIFQRDELPKKELIVIMIVLFILNYFLFIHKGNYLTIAKELKKETLKIRKANTFLLWLYVVLSLALFAFGAIFIRKLNG